LAVQIQFENIGILQSKIAMLLTPANLKVHFWLLRYQVFGLILEKRFDVELNELVELREYRMVESQNILIIPCVIDFA